MRRLSREGVPTSFSIYAFGFTISISGLIYASYLLPNPAHWIVVGSVALLGVGILTEVKATRQRDPAR
jgi:hypothetical protein